MYDQLPAPVVQRRMGFGTALVLGVTAIVMTVIVCGTGIAIYGLRVVDRKANDAIGLVTNTFEHLDELQDALPPALAEALDDERKPEYRDQLAVNVKLVDDDRKGSYSRAVVEVENKGDETVSYLSMRLVGMDSQAEPLFEKKVWAATPLQVEDEWRGPLLPRQTRRFSVPWSRRGDASTVIGEITDLRIWRGPYEDAAMEMNSDNDGAKSKSKA